MSAISTHLKKTTTYILLVASMALTAHSFALPEDSQKPIYISSDSALKDNKQGLTIYTGNVNMQQGTLNISGDKVTIYSEVGQVTKIVAVGKPAHFQQQPSLERGNVLAKGNHINYAVNKKHITLTGNASLDQNGSMMKGNKIHYDINAARVKADGSGKKINVVIPPPKAP